MRHFLDFQALEQFITLARTQNFTRAAEELHLSQPALSRAIQRLEAQVGQPLFDRRPREVVLTKPGELLVSRAKKILDLVEDTFTELAESGEHGQIRLGAIPTIAPYFLPKLLSTFAEKFPRISVTVQEDTTNLLIRRCADGELDLAIVALPIQAKAIRIEPLFSEELLFVVPRGHPLATTKDLTLKAVKDYPFVMLNEAHCLSENITSFCQRQSVHPISIERTSQLTTVQELVALDHGVSIIPDMARQIDLSEGRVYRSFSGAKPYRTIAMMWNDSRYESQAVKTLKTHLRQSVKRRAAKTDWSPL
jgi:LysR family transcriptional regulator, hydrogen peroxide-inducible genes activator